MNFALRCQKAEKGVPVRKMPLTRDSFMLHLQRVMYQLCIWKHAHIPIHNTPLSYREVTQLPQRNRSAGWVSFEWVVGDGVSQTILCTKPCWRQKTQSIDLLHDKSTFIRKWSLCVFETLFGGLQATYAVHRRLIGKPVVDFLLVIIQLFSLGAMA